MPTHSPQTSLRTHDVSNQPPPLVNYDAYAADLPLREAVAREGAAYAEPRISALGRDVGSEEMIELGALANRHPPELRSFDRYGQRIDEVEFHPAYHALFRRAIAARIPSLPWAEPRPGAHVAHAALCYLFTQAEAGVLCPVAMTYAVVPALAHQPELAARWVPRVISPEYDPRCIPAEQKRGATFGMAMTEKQGGSDVRQNSTRARPEAAPGPGRSYRLTGHKWFCSAPMSDAFLTLAQTEAGLGCFLVPRFCPDGTRNRFAIQRLKDKLGNRSNASSEIEYDETYAELVGEEGRGVATILEMVQHTRLDAAIAPAAMMRQGLLQAVHHARHRRAFGKLLIDQPLMQSVLADLCVDSEAATQLALRLARAYDEDDPSFRRLATTVAKYWVCKATPPLVAEALECIGGSGYVEESVLPRLYRESPVNSVWEGPANVQALDVLRAITRQPESVDAVLREIEPAIGLDPRLDDAVVALREELADLDERGARRLVELLALCLMGSLLLRNGPAPLAEAFCATRLGGDGGRSYGTLPRGVDAEAIVARHLPRV